MQDILQYICHFLGINNGMQYFFHCHADAVGQFGFIMQYFFGNKIQYHADCQYRTMYLSWIIMQFLLQYDTVPLYIYDHAVQLTFVFHYAIIMLVRYNLVRELGGLTFFLFVKK